MRVKMRERPELVSIRFRRWPGNRLILTGQSVCGKRFRKRLNEV